MFERLVIGSALALCTLSAPLAAEEDDKTRFDETGFLESLDLFISEQAPKSKTDKADKKSAPDANLDLSLRDGSASKGGDFLYLKDASYLSSKANSSTPSRPDFSSLYSADGTVRPGLGSSLVDAYSRVGLTLGGKTDENGLKQGGVEVALESAYRLSRESVQAGLVDDIPMRALSVADSSYNIGLSVGYEGFNIDASWLESAHLFDPDVTGYEAGFSYSLSRFTARVSMAEYTRGVDLLGLTEEARILALELGAQLRLSDRIGLKGGVRYYDYGDQWVLNPDSAEDSQMIFLGGNFRF